MYRVFNLIKNRMAMTLIEVMVALSIFSVMSLLTMQTLTGGFKVKRALDDRYLKYQTVRAIFLMIERDLRLIHHYFGDTSLGNINKMHSIYIASELMFNSFFVGTKERIDFTTTSEFVYQTKKPKSRLVEVSYYLEPSELGLGYKLMRRKSLSVDDNPTEGGNSVVLADNIASIEFKFFDSNNIQENYGSWVDEWNSTEGEKMHSFPKAVKLTISFIRSDEYEEVFTDIIEILAPNNRR